MTPSPRQRKASYDPLLHLELRCADDGGVGRRKSRAEADLRKVADYLTVRYKYGRLHGAFAGTDVEVRAEDADDKYGCHSNGYLIFRLSKLPFVVGVLAQIDAEPPLPEDPWGDPDNWPEADFWGDCLWYKDDRQRITALLHSMEGERGFLVGDVLDVPDGFPPALAEQIERRYGWRIEDGWSHK